MRLSVKNSQCYGGSIPPLVKGNGVCSAFETNGANDMSKYYYQVAEFRIVDGYRTQEFLTYRSKWWTDNLPVKPGFQTMFLITTEYHDKTKLLYHVDVKAYRRNDVSPSGRKVA